MGGLVRGFDYVEDTFSQTENALEKLYSLPLESTVQVFQILSNMQKEQIEIAEGFFRARGASYDQIFTPLFDMFKGGVSDVIKQKD